MSAPDAVDGFSTGIAMCQDCGVLGTAGKAFKKLERWIMHFAGQMLRMAALKCLTSDEFIASVYVTGLYHGMMLTKRRKSSEQ